MKNVMLVLWLCLQSRGKVLNNIILKYLKITKYLSKCTILSTTPESPATLHLSSSVLTVLYCLCTTDFCQPSSLCVQNVKQPSGGSISYTEEFCFTGTLDLSKTIDYFQLKEDSCVCETSPTWFDKWLFACKITY